MQALRRQTSIIVPLLYITLYKSQARDYHVGNVPPVGYSCLRDDKPFMLKTRYILGKGRCNARVTARWKNRRVPSAFGPRDAPPTTIPRLHHAGA